MKHKVMIQVVAENYIEEQILLNEFQDAVWIKLNNKALFFVSHEDVERVKKLEKELEKEDE